MLQQKVVLENEHRYLVTGRPFTNPDMPSIPSEVDISDVLYKEPPD